MTPEMIEAFAATERFTEELIQAGVFVAAAVLKNSDEICSTGLQRFCMRPPPAPREASGVQPILAAGQGRL
jgi:hypothetical protein